MYYKFIFIFVCFSHLSSIYGQSISAVDQLKEDNLPSSRKLHKCDLSNNQYSFNVMPGTGWDNLVNQEMGQVIQFTYNKCKSSNDGKFLVPDDVIISPIKRSIVILDSEIFAHYSNYTSMTSKSINLEANHVTPQRKISGSYSYEKSSVKNDQIREKSKATRTQLRYELYTVSYQPDIQLNEKFKNRILEIGSVILADVDQLYPKYLADLIIRDFGTHIIKSIDAGAILSKTDVIKSSFAKKYESDETEIRAAASFSMAAAFSIDLKVSKTTSQQKLDDYNSNCASIRINTFGGKIFGSKFTVDEWEKTLDENLVVVDRRGDPLHSVLTPSNVQELDKRILFHIIQLIKEAANRYYEANTRIGCMDMRSPNFNVDANVDSGDCQEPEIKFNFGGIYQQCIGDYNLCSEISQTNPETGTMSCPVGYDSVFLQSEQYKCQTDCESRLIFWTSCNTRCAKYYLYWCSPSNSPTRGNGFLFGGSYTNSAPNPITNANTCPQYYIPVKFGATATICLSSEKENGFKYSIPFGGIYSCNTGNPLSDDKNHIMQKEYWLMSCARGYSSHLITVDRTCQISYCAQKNTGRSISEPPIIRPPFIDIGFGPNITQESSFKTPNGVVMRLSSDGSWKESSKESSTSISWTIATSVLSTVFIGLLLAAIIFVIEKYRTRRLNKVGNGDTEMMIQEVTA